MRAGIYLCLLAWGCAAQSASLEGELAARRPQDFSHLEVRLETSRPGGVERTTVSVGGNFRFLHVDEGHYTLVVADEAGNVITREPILVQPSNPEIKVQLPEDPAAERPEGSVSVAQLRHPPEPRAYKAAVKAQERSAAGDYRGAAAELEKAVAFDPQYAAAHSNLGAQYVRLGQPAKAAGEFERAIALDPSSSMPQANLALALAQLGRTAEAVEWSRHALQVDSTNAVGHYVLGCILAQSHDTGARAEGIRHLELAARSLPSAATALTALRR